MKTALICGVAGQDGAYLAKLLIQKGYNVHGTSRDAQISTFQNLKRLGIFEQVNLLSMVLTDFRSVLQAIMQVHPDEIYNLAGQSSVGLSFEQPVETLESVGMGTLNLLEAIRFSQLPIRFYNAGSSECFGDTGENPADEDMPFRPKSPYAVAKATAFWEVDNYREAYGLFACSGILFNHESPLRPERFVTRKITATAVKIANGEDIKLTLGNLDVWRDWGYAPEYVEAMWMMLQKKQADDYIVATGESHSLKEFVQRVFERLSLDWNQHVEINESLFRPSDLKNSRANPDKVKNLLGWRATTKFRNLIELLVDEELNRRK